MNVALRVNGKIEHLDIDPGTPPLYVLRGELKLNAAKFQRFEPNLDFWQWGGGWWAGYHYCGGWAYQYGYAPHSCYIFGGG